MTDAVVTNDDATRSDSPRGVTPPSKPEGRGGFLDDVIVEMGFATREEVDEATRMARQGATPAAILLEGGVIDDDQLARAIAERNGLDHVDLDEVDVDMGVAALIGRSTAERYEAVPIAFDPNGKIVVALADPVDALAVSDIAEITRSEVRPVVASSSDIGAVIACLPADRASAPAIQVRSPESPSAESATGADLDGLLAADGEADAGTGAVPDVGSKSESKPRSESRAASEDGDASRSRLRDRLAALIDDAVEEATRSEVTELQSELATSRTELDGTRAEIESARSELKGGRAELESARADLESARADLEGQRAELESRRAELESKDAELEGTRAELDSTRGKLESKQAELESTQVELESKLEGTRADADSTRAELESTKADLDSKRVELEGARTELESTRAELETAQGDLESMGAKLERTRVNLQSARAEIDNTSGEADGLRSRLAEAGERAGALRAALADVSAAADRARTVADELAPDDPGDGES